MAKHTQAIPRQQPAICLSVFNHFVGLALKGLKLKIITDVRLIRPYFIKKAASPKWKKDTFSSFSRGTFFHATLMLIYEMPKTGPGDKTLQCHPEVNCFLCWISSSSLIRDRVQISLLILTLSRRRPLSYRNQFIDFSPLISLW